MVRIDSLAVEVVVEKPLPIVGLWAQARSEARPGLVFEPLEHRVDGVKENFESERDEILQNSFHVDVEVNPWKLESNKLPDG